MRGFTAGGLGNAWAQRTSFAKKPKKYDLVEVDADDVEVAQLPGSAPASAQLPCSLAPEVADFVKLIFDHGLDPPAAVKLPGRFSQ